jgi:hypothetical protein
MELLFQAMVDRSRARLHMKCLKTIFGRKGRLFPASARSEEGARGAVTCKARLGGLLKYYSRAA